MREMCVKSLNMLNLAQFKRNLEFFLKNRLE